MAQEQEQEQEEDQIKDDTMYERTADLHYWKPEVIVDESMTIAHQWAYHLSDLEICEPGKKTTVRVDFPETMLVSSNYIAQTRHCTSLFAAVCCCLALSI